MIVLGVTHGHDSAACLFRDQELVAFCKEERLDRIKNSAGPFKLNCITEVLEIAGVKAEEIDAIGMAMGPMPANVYSSFKYRIKEILNSLKGRKKEYSLYGEMKRSGISDPKSLINESAIRSTFGLNINCKIFFCDHHYSHALATYRYTDWQSDALYITCNRMGASGIQSKFATISELQSFLKKLAASIQEAQERVVLSWLKPLVEEPIINTPAEAVRALVTNRVDFLVMKGLMLEPN